VLSADQPLVALPPYQAPHHGATSVSVVGGGSGIARPGAASLAHRGVLFLDEAPEFSRGVLDALRQPLESGRITIRRVGGTATYPARFSLVLAANPCPCAQPSARCTCPSAQRRGYLARLSGPLLDRVDVQVHLPDITRVELDADGGEGSTAIAARVAAARERAVARFAGTPWRTNADVPAPELTRRWPLPREARRLLADAVDRGLLTARGYGRLQRVAWTLADLIGNERPTRDDVAAALGLRLGDAWGPGVAA
jgi:magnesium chelatase family protein